MTKKNPKESSLSMKPHGSQKISAKRSKSLKDRIRQGDIFEDLEIIESIEVIQSKVILKKIVFPYAICLNQECDLETDFITNGKKNCDKNLIHIAIAPAFIFEQFLTGKHWDEIFIKESEALARTSTSATKITNNEIPRYHYLKFPDKDMPELILDFKHFFTINRSEIYRNIDKRICSLDDLFRESINQRFSSYISRIGLPEEPITQTCSYES